MCTDCVIYGGVSEDDFIDLMKELSHPWNNRVLYEKYKVESVKESEAPGSNGSKHAKMIMNLSVPSYNFDFE